MTEKELHKNIMFVIFYQYKSMWEMTYHPVNEAKWNRWDEIFMGNARGVPHCKIKLSGISHDDAGRRFFRLPQFWRLHTTKEVDRDPVQKETESSFTTIDNR